MDKLFYRGGIEVDGFERFGQDVVVEDGAEAEQIVKLGFEKAWVTDHLGIKAGIKLSEKSPSRL
jgi:tyrosyl-DNA phosphodiesterase 2